jgi:hypothetical protein
MKPLEVHLEPEQPKQHNPEPSRHVFSVIRQCDYRTVHTPDILSSSTEQSPSLKDDSRSAGQDIPPLSRKPNTHYRIHQWSPYLTTNFKSGSEDGNSSHYNRGAAGASFWICVWFKIQRSNAIQIPLKCHGPISVKVQTNKKTDTCITIRTHIDHNHNCDDNTAFRLV